MTTPSNTGLREAIEARIFTFMDDSLHIILEDEGDTSEIPRPAFVKDLAAQLTQLFQARERQVDRFEVIDDTGRAYVKGSVYGSPVSIELSYQDDGKTLKVFVTDRNKTNDGGQDGDSD